MRQRSETLAVAARRRFTEITAAVAAAVRASGVREGLCTVFIRHTSASLALALGTWQGLYVWEHRTGSHRRHVAVHVMGE